MPHLLSYPCSLAVLVLLAFGLSEGRKNISYKVLALGILWHIAFATILFKTPGVDRVFSAISSSLDHINAATTKAMQFCFGGLASPPPESGLGFILAMQGFPVIIIIAALSSLLIHWRILPFVIKLFSFVYKRTLKVGGTLGLAVSANMFTGMAETPLVIKPYLRNLTHSELFSLMVCGTAGIAASVIALYSMILGTVVTDSIRHITTAMILNIPASLLFARIIVPETVAHLTEGDDINMSTASSTLDAISSGIMDGALVTVTIIAMLIGFVALIDIANLILAALPISINGVPLSLQSIFGLIMAPFAYLMGIPFNEIRVAGSLIGIKFILNEIIAYNELVVVSSELSARSRTILSYALCGFANLGSIGIMIGVYGSLVPERKQEVMSFGLPSAIAGFCANCLTASLAGIFLT